MTMAELFEQFEVNREPRWPKLLQLTGASAILHLMALVCVFYVPAVRDAVNIAAMVAATTYVDRPYAKTRIGEDVRIVSLQKFRYPEGYFALQMEPELIAKNQVPDPFEPRIISRAQPERTPTPEPSPSPQPSPSPAASPSPSASVAVEAAASPAASPPKSPSEVDQQLDQIASENNVVRPSENEVNTRPLKDWLARANGLKEKGELDLSSLVEITIAGNLTSNCKLVDAKVIQKSGDSRLVDVAKDMVSAIGDSGMLSFLRDPQKVKDSSELRCDEIPLQLTMKLDQNEVSAKVESQADTPDRAAQMADGYSRLLGVGQLLKRGRDEELLYKSTKVTSEGKQITVHFSMPRQTASEMLKKQLRPAT